MILEDMFLEALFLEMRCCLGLPSDYSRCVSGGRCLGDATATTHGSSFSSIYRLSPLGFVSAAVLMLAHATTALSNMFCEVTPLIHILVHPVLERATAQTTSRLESCLRMHT